MTEIAITAGRTPALAARIADHASTSVTLSLAVTKPLPHRPPRPVTVANPILTKVPMTKTTLALPTLPLEEPSGKQLKREAHILQSAFLAENLGRLVTIYTINGIKLVGRLRQFDQFTLLLQGPDRTHSLVFKHAVSTIAPVPANDRHE